MRRYFPFSILIFLSLHAYRSHAQHEYDNPISGQDSIILARHIIHERKELAALYGTDTVSLTLEQLDSIDNAGPGGIGGGIVRYAPDSAFKIFVIDGEDCGAHCSPFWISYLHLTGPSGKIFTEPQFRPVGSIYIMPDEKYLVIQDAGERCGPTYCITRYASLISIYPDSVISTPIRYQDPRYERDGHKPPYIDPDFVIWQEGWVDGDISMYYDETLKRLNYQYCILHFDEEGPELPEGFYRATLYEGYFLYENGVFAHKSETAKPIEVKEQQ